MIYKYNGHEKSEIIPPIKAECKILNMSRKKTDSKYINVWLKLTYYSGLNWNNERLFVGKHNDNYLTINENNILSVKES